MVYLDEGVDVPDIPNVNYVQVRQEAAAESGRVYEALGDIVINPENAFQAVNAFNVKEGNTITMETQLGSSKTGEAGWKTLVLPFAPSIVTDAAGKEMTQYARNGATNPNGLYMTAALGADGSLVLTEGIEANRPYLASLFQEAGTASVRFVAGKCEVPQTPDEIRVEGSDYALMATFAEREAAAVGTYLLSEDGSAFTSVDYPASEENGSEEDAARNVTLRPFTVYATSDAEVSNFPVSVDVSNMTPTGISVSEETPAFMTSREGDVLVIYSDSETTIDVFGIAGQLVTTLQLTRGRNVIENLAPGVYIIRGQKVVL